MKRVTKCRMFAIVLAVCMILTGMPIDLLGGVLTAHAATESEQAGMVEKTVGEWTTAEDGSQSRTTTWVFNGASNILESGMTQTAGNTLQGILIGGSEKTVTMKGASEGMSIKPGGYVNIPLDESTTKVELYFLIQSTDSDRYVEIGDAVSQKVYHSESNASKTDADGVVTKNNVDKQAEFTGTYASTYFTGSSLKLATGTTNADGGDSGEVKFLSLSITEYAEAAEEAMVEFTRTYDFRDGSIVPIDTDGKSDVTSADEKLTVKVGPSNAYAYNDTSHGSLFKAGNSIVIKVQKGSGTVTIGDCNYSKTDAIDVTLGGEAIGTISPATSGNCYHNSTADTQYVLSIDYVCEAEEAELVLAFNNQVYVPVIIVSGTEPKPAVTEVTANITVNANNLLAEGDTITLVKDGAEPIDITNANATDVVLDVNSTYKIVSSNADTKAVVGTVSTVTTTTENLTVVIDVVATVVKPTVKFVDEDGVLGEAVITLTNEADATDVVTLKDGEVVKLKIGATYKVVSSLEAVVAAIAGSTFVKVEDALTELAVDITELDLTKHAYDVWDFGAEQLVGTELITYNNKLTVDIINSWYAADTSIVAGTQNAAYRLPVDTNDIVVNDAEGNPEFVISAGENGALKGKYRLRANKNSGLTRDSDEDSISDEFGNAYQGLLYDNAGKGRGVKLQLAVEPGDIVTVIVSSNGGESTINWESPSGVVETQKYTRGSRTKMQTMKFYAGEEGLYDIYSTDEKLVVARILRERPAKAAVSGTVTAPVDLNGKTLVFTDTTTGAAVEATITDGSYTVNLPQQYKYNVSLKGANGYIVDENNSFKLKNEQAAATFNVNVLAVELVTVNGSLADLPADMVEKLTLTFTADAVYIPEYTLKAEDSTFTAVLEKGVTYTVAEAGVEDYILETTSIMADADGTQNIKFTKKPAHAVNVAFEGITAEEAANVKLTFSRLKDVSEEVVLGTPDEGYVYTFTGTEGIELRDGQYQVVAELEGYAQGLTADVKVNGAAVDKRIVMKSVNAEATPVEYKEVITVGAEGDYKTINEALDAVRSMTRTEEQRVTISIAPGNYEEMLIVDVPNVTLKNASETPSIALTDKGVNIDENAVRITSYYGHGYAYSSMNEDWQYDAELLAVNKENGYYSVKNIGSGSKTMWNATVQIKADGFQAEGIIFENSFNQYMSQKATEDVIWKVDGAKEGTVARASMEAGDVTVQNKAYVERAAALAMHNNLSDIIFDNCKFIGRQDTLYGGTNTYVEFNECSVYGATDYIFGGMIAIFNKCDLVFNTSEDKNDVGYITAAQQSVGRGYLMYECHVTSTTPGVDTASEKTSKPGFFGRPWAASTSEVVFYNTTIDAADPYWETATDIKNPGRSLIAAAGWDSSLSGTSAGMYEYGTIEKAEGVDNSASRATWATLLSEAVLNDGTEITFEAFREAEPITDYYEINLTEGLKAGEAYEGGISVLEDMAFKADVQNIGGTAVAGYVAGSSNPKEADGTTNPKGTVPASGSVLVLNAEKDGRLKVAMKVNSGKTVYLVEQNGETAALASSYENTGASSAFIAQTYEVKAGCTYYLYGNGTKVPMYAISVDYREPEIWANIAAPVLGTPVVDAENGTITVPFTAQVGSIYADAIDVAMLLNGEVVETITYAAAAEKGEVVFTPTASAEYTFKATLKREGEEGKNSAETDKAAFVLPMAEPVISNVENLGSGKMKLSWQAVPEADSYNVYVDGVLHGTTKELMYKLEGLTVGQEYEFGVEAVGNEDVSSRATIKQTVSAEAVKTWQYAAFGSGVDTKNNGYSGSIDTNDLSLWSLAGKGKLVPASTDGLAFYYTTMDPATENFTLSADVEVVEWSFSNGQEGFGLMAADRVGVDGDAGTFWNNSYMASVTKVEYIWDSANKVVSDSGDKYTMKLGIGAQEKIGVTAENMAAGNTVDYFSSSMSPLETSCADAGLGAGTYNIIGNCTNEDVLTGNQEKLTTTFHLTIQRNNTGYFLSYTDEEGNTITQKYYHSEDGDELTKLDENNIYVGFFASRNAKINIKNVELTTINPADDAEAEERPVTYVTPNFSMESAKNANAAEYEMVYYGNADGVLNIKDAAGNAVLADKQVTAGEKVRVTTTLAEGDNSFVVTMDPDENYQLSKYEKLSSYETVTFNFTVTYKTSDKEDIYISPDGTADGDGSREKPVDIYTAVQYPAPGQKLVLMEGTYKLSKTVTVNRGINGTEDNMIYLMADSEAETRPVLDFQGICAGMVFAGDYWYIQGFDVTNSANAQKGVQISGDNNVVDGLYTYRNGNTGIQISRYLGTDSWEDWPSDNLILNCTSYLNADAGYEDADGFAAKLTVADGNVFDGCIAAFNADDGWDLFAKVESGPIGNVTIRNCVAFKNGYDIKDGEIVNAGNGNGFKMGGSSISGKHLLENSIAFGNKAKGIDSNSGPDIIVKNSTSFENESYNVALYTNDAANTDYSAEGIISYKVDGTVAEQFKLKGTQDESKVYGTTNYYFDGTKSVNSEGTEVTADWFVSLDMDTVVDEWLESLASDPAANAGITRNADGSINMNGFLELTDAAPADAGARMPEAKLVITDIDESHWGYTFVTAIAEQKIMNGVHTNEDGSIEFAPNDKLTREMVAQILYNAEGTPEVTTENEFTDVVAGAWYEKAVTWAAANGIVSGYPDGTFGVGKNITRQEIATMLRNYATYKQYDTTASGELSSFEDVAAVEDWATESMSWAVGNNIITGKAGNLLDPQGDADRAQAATMIYKFMNAFEGAE